jgi:hypothetical protein
MAHHSSKSKSSTGGGASDNRFASQLAMESMGDGGPLRLDNLDPASPALNMGGNGGGGNFNVNIVHQ